MASAPATFAPLSTRVQPGLVCQAGVVLSRQARPRRHQQSRRSSCSKASVLAKGTGATESASLSAAAQPSTASAPAPPSLGQLQGNLEQLKDRSSKVAQSLEDAVLPPKAHRPQPLNSGPTGPVASGQESHISSTSTAVQPSAGSHFQEVTSSLADGSVQAPSQASVEVQGNVSNAAEAVKETATSSGRTLESIQQSYEQAVSGSLQNKGAGSSDLVHSVQDAVAGAVHSVQDAASSAVQTAQDALQSASTTLSQATSAFNESSGGGVRGAQDAVESIAAASQAALAGVGAQLGDVTQEVTNAIPPEVREAVAAASGPAQKLFTQITSSAPATATVIGVPLLLFWTATRGGFSGYLSPDASLDLLKKRNAVLVDLRPLEQRSRDGIPELRFGARGKGAALEIPSLARSSTSRARNGGDLPYLVAAIEIQGLKQVSRGSQILILEGRRRDGLRLARALKSQGQSKSYIVQGGFAAWQAAGLPIKSAVDYETSAFDALTDEAEAIATNLKRTVTYLRDPANVAITGIVAAGAVNTVRDWHNTLQVIGVYGPLLSTSLYLRSFSSFQAAVEDVQKRFDGFASGFSRLLPKPAPAQPAAARASAAASGRDATVPFSKVLPDAPKSAPAAAQPAAPKAQPEQSVREQDRGPQQTQAPPATSGRAEPESPPAPASGTSDKRTSLGQSQPAAEAAVKADTVLPAQSRSPASGPPQASAAGQAAPKADSKPARDSRPSASEQPNSKGLSSQSPKEQSPKSAGKSSGQQQQSGTGKPVSQPAKSAKEGSSKGA